MFVYVSYDLLSDPNLFFQPNNTYSKLGLILFSCNINSFFICRYRNYPPEQLVDIIARILAMVPPWTRVYRVQRDIPMPLVTSGVEKGNLRELALARMDDLGLKCRDVRTREAGIQVSGHNHFSMGMSLSINWKRLTSSRNKDFTKNAYDFRTFTTKLSLKKWSWFVAITWQMKVGKHFSHTKIHARYF